MKLVFVLCKIFSFFASTNYERKRWFQKEIHEYLKSIWCVNNECINFGFHFLLLCIRSIQSVKTIRQNFPNASKCAENWSNTFTTMKFTGNTKRALSFYEGQIFCILYFKTKFFEALSFKATKKVFRKIYWYQFPFSMLYLKSKTWNLCPKNKVADV